MFDNQRVVLFILFSCCYSINLLIELKNHNNNDNNDKICCCFSISLKYSNYKFIKKI